MASLTVDLPFVFSRSKPSDRIVYSCKETSKDRWSCEKGRFEDKIWVEVCNYQPESWHRAVLAVKLGAKGVDLEDPSVKK